MILELFAKLATHLENARYSENEGITGQEDAKQPENDEIGCNNNERLENISNER